MEERGLLGAGLLLVAAFIVAVLATGNSSWVIPGLVFLGLLLAGWGVSLLLQRRAEGVDAAGDSDEPAPLTASRPAGGDLGDDEQHHDEISPHDLPRDHPGRHEAERITGDARFERDDAGVTRGNR